MLTSKARRRLALKTSAFALLGAGIFGVMPAIAALATPTTVPYVCTPGVGAPQGAPTSTVTFNMELATPAGVTPHATATVNWRIVQPSLAAPASIAPNATIVAEATVTPSGSPVPSAPVVATGAATPATGFPSGSPVAIPTMNIVVTPTATGTVFVKGDAFAVKVNNSVLYNCTPTPTGMGPSANFVVATGTGTGTGTGTPTTSNTPTTTPPTSTPTTHTPKPTKTTTKFVTATPTKKSSKTPKAGADTGGGGEIGPDGRVFLLVGSLLIVGAGAGGLVLRRRGLGKG